MTAHPIRCRANLAILARVDLSRFVSRVSGVVFLEGGGLLVGDVEGKRLVRISGGHAQALLDGTSVSGIIRGQGGVPYVSFDGEPTKEMEKLAPFVFVSRPVATVDSRGRLFGLFAQAEGTDGPLAARVDPARGEEIRYNRQLREHTAGEQPSAGYLRVNAIQSRADDTVFFLGLGTIARVEGYLNLLIEMSPEGAIRKGYPYATQIHRDSLVSPDGFLFAEDGTYAGEASLDHGEDLPPVGFSLEYKALAPLSDGGMVFAEDRELFFVRPGRTTPVPLALSKAIGAPLAAPWHLTTYGETFSFLNTTTNVVYRAAVSVEEEESDGL